MDSKTPLSPKLLQGMMRLELGETHPVFTAFDKGKRWEELERYCNLALHAYFVEELPDNFLKANDWKRVDKDKVESPWAITLGFGDGTVAVRRTSPYRYDRTGT